MPPKRKADALDDPVVESEEVGGDQSKEGKPKRTTVKKARVKKTTDTSPSEDAAAESSKTGLSKAADKETTSAKTWQDIKLDGEEENGVRVYDDCNEIRRKIRLLQKEPGFKVTHWLKAIGSVNSNSFQRFMKATGPTGGAGNGTYYYAYIYFEKRRIFEGKKKTQTRLRNEKDHPQGFLLVEQRWMWVRT